MKTKKYLKIASLAVVAAIFIWTFVFLYRKSQPTVKVYETIVPETADLEKTTVATGKVEPRDEVLIKPQISGIISEVYKEAGQSVKQGEVIAKVKVIPELGTLNSAESRVRLAEINAKQAETDFARVEKLFIIGAQCSLENGGVRDDIGGRTCGKIADGQHTGLAGIRLTGDQRFQRQIDVNPNVNGINGVVGIGTVGAPAMDCDPEAVHGVHHCAAAVVHEQAHRHPAGANMIGQGPVHAL